MPVLNESASFMVSTIVSVQRHADGQNDAIVDTGFHDRRRFRRIGPVPLLADGRGQPGEDPFWIQLSVE